jgi:hypothetical protein
MTPGQLIEWLLEGDASIQYQVHRDLLNSEQPRLREQIAKEGWGALYLACRNKNGFWGEGFYMHKWTSTHYTLLDLKNLGISPNTGIIKETLALILKNKALDGGIRLVNDKRKSDVCVNGMFLNYAAYFRVNEAELHSVVDSLLSHQMPDGGFNCHLDRIGAVHSSLHSTLSVAEGFLEYARNGYNYRLSEVEKAERESREFMLQHKLFQSHRTGKTIDPKMLMLSYPSRWRYDILRALDYFQMAGVDFDVRMQDAIDIVWKKRKSDQTWPVQAKHSGLTHFDMEKTGQSSRWNTLRALRVLKKFMK